MRKHLPDVCTACVVATLPTVAYGPAWLAAAMFATCFVTGVLGVVLNREIKRPAPIDGRTPKSA